MFWIVLLILSNMYFIYLTIKKNDKEFHDNLDKNDKEDSDNGDLIDKESAYKYEINSLREDIGSLQLLLTSKAKDLDETTRKLQDSEDKIIKQEEISQKVLSMKKSSEIRLGNAAEQLAPFLDGFAHDPRHLRFLGSPIDYLAFDKDCVTFIEIKSGNSHLSHNQKNIKRLIKNGQVKWQEFRISGKDKKK